MTSGRTGFVLLVIGIVAIAVGAAMRVTALRYVGVAAIVLAALAFVAARGQLSQENHRYIRDKHRN